MRILTSQCLGSKNEKPGAFSRAYLESDYGNSTSDNKLSVPSINCWCIFGVVFNRSNDCARYDEHNQLSSW